MWYLVRVSGKSCRAGVQRQVVGRLQDLRPCAWAGSLETKVTRVSIVFIAGTRLHRQLPGSTPCQEGAAFTVSRIPGLALPLCV